MFILHGTPLQQRLPLAVLKQKAHGMYTDWGGLLVATALTACGIETVMADIQDYPGKDLLQQRLPLAVLKHISNMDIIFNFFWTVATALTACGIETKMALNIG